MKPKTGKRLNFITDEELTCLKTKEWTPLERGHIEHKFYCSDGETGELALIREHHGKTVVVELVGKDVDPTPDLLVGPPSMTPECIE